jgi:hypothetical protein
MRLSSTNTTTNEYCKKTWGVMPGNPFSKITCFKNIAKILFGGTARNKRLFSKEEHPKHPQTLLPPKQLELNPLPMIH